MTTPSAPERVAIVREFPDTSWGDDGPTRGVERIVEDGLVLSFPQLPFGPDGVSLTATGIMPATTRLRDTTHNE